MFTRHPSLPSIAFANGEIFGLYLYEELWPTPPFKDEYGIGWMDEQHTVPACVAVATTKVNTIEEFNRLNVSDIEF